MAIRKVLIDGDETLRKICKPVENFDNKLHQALDDMKETLYKANGVGLAAPQIGLLRRIVVIDVGDGLIELINPVITSRLGEQRNVEGCLSCPDKWGYVTRPEKVHVKAQDRNGEFFEYDGEGLLAICTCHELDHLDGKLFIDIVEEYIQPGEDEE